MATKYPTRQQIEALPEEKLLELVESVGLKPRNKLKRRGDLANEILSLPKRWEDGTLFARFFPEGASSARSPGKKSPKGGKAKK